MKKFTSNKQIKKPTLKILENSKVQLAIFIIADIIIIINIIIFVNMRLDKSNIEQPIPSVSSESESELDIDKVFNDADDFTNSALLNLIKGNYVTSDNKMFSFKSDGSYNGYFDAANPDISGGEYTVKMTENGETIVVITYNNKSIEYVQTYDDSLNFALTSAEGTFILLE